MKRNNSPNISPEKLVNKYGGLVSALCYRMIPDSHIAEEAAQEVWYEVLKGLDNFRGDAQITTWIYKIAYRVISKYGPNQRLYDTKFLKFCFDGPDIRIPDNVNYDRRLIVKELCDRCLTGVLQCLTPEKKLAFILRDGAQLSYEDISEIMDKKEATVRKIVSRSRKKLRNFLNNQCTLYTPEGNCNCRIKDVVEEVELETEYKKIRELIGEARFYSVSEKVLPKKNYWKKFL